MVQLKAHPTRTLPCPVPDDSVAIHKGKRCPPAIDGEDNGTTCLNGNKGYKTLEKAWEACGHVEGCGTITQDSDWMWYLRRLADPDISLKGLKLHTYNCLQADVAELFNKVDNEACGWADDDPDCKENNYAFVNSGFRSAQNINREQALAVCGRICASNQTECGGFAWDQSQQTCFFRRNTRCGLKRLGSGSVGDCYELLTEVDRAM